MLNVLKFHLNLKQEFSYSNLSFSIFLEVRIFVEAKENELHSLEDLELNACVSLWENNV